MTSGLPECFDSFLIRIKDASLFRRNGKKKKNVLFILFSFANVSFVEVFIDSRLLDELLILNSLWNSEFVSN